jgi:predicted flap endonuclease-1-like 5' DNA nuclease
MAKSIEALEGIGPKYGAKLRAVGCTSPDKLLQDGATRKGRREIAAKTGIREAVILRCVNMADLFRIKGVATQYAELLEAAGVDTVKELKQRNAKNLAHAMREINDKRNLVRQVPNEKMVTAWVAHAKKLKPAVTY